MGDKEFGIDPKRIAEYAEEIKAVAELGVQVGVVIGGGNICDFHARGDELRG